MKIKKHIALSPEVYNKVEKLSQTNHRSVSNQIEVLLKLAFSLKAKKQK